jgi:DNA-binding GntR family transcriptional regulator
MTRDRFAAIVEATPALPDRGSVWSATLVRVDLNEQAYQWLRERLLTRQFGPGEKLGLQALANELGVSRSSVHHARRGLSARGS